MSNKLVMNERIGGTHVRLIDENNVQKGVVSLREALWHANNAGMDLVKIAEANPPVCKVVDAGKYAYELQKQQKVLAKKQRENTVEIKEVQLRPATGLHDLQIKARKAKEFLNDGDKVKVVVRFHGREKSMKHQGHEVLAQFMSELGTEVKPDRPVTDSGNSLTVILTSSTPKVPKAA